MSFGAQCGVGSPFDDTENTQVAHRNGEITRTQNGCTLALSLTSQLLITAVCGCMGLSGFSAFDQGSITASKLRGSSR